MAYVLSAFDIVQPLRWIGGADSCDHGGDGVGRADITEGNHHSMFVGGENLCVGEVLGEALFKIFCELLVLGVVGLA
ncbi:hypothetical protein FRC0411_02163 [Corynebacterium diphtheriae]|nr:hypothetical protein CIP100294_01970 [Corynebacterium diphtheriae]CAB0918532.1 hypothetical protein FRC0411_02163 [Corynebacterium diphtheriae]CAB1010835.1 hypothetical protein FRC0492_02108 [Corynebacterium diphtheriae]CAB1022926.1 hypothetical protein FRC0522_01969 [Corynebacterium diphtheriae]